VKIELKQTIALQEEAEARAPEVVEESVVQEFAPAPKKSRRVNVNPPGQRGTKKRRPKPQDFEFEEVREEV